MIDISIALTVNYCADMVFTCAIPICTTGYDGKVEPGRLHISPASTLFHQASVEELKNQDLTPYVHQRFYPYLGLVYLVASGPGVAPI